jgi:hypothetical protein
VFTRWCNAVLKVRSYELRVLEPDLHDGLALIQLLEILSGESIGAKYNRVPRHRAQKLENVMIALKFVTETKKIKLVNIGPEDLVDQKTTLVLGLIWTLILHFQVAHGNQGKHDELLAWVQKQIPDMKITNLTGDFRDGKAIVALLHSVQPKFERQYKATPVANAEYAFAAAEQLCGIPRLLDPEDLCVVADDLSNRAYISYYRDYAESNNRVVEGPLRPPLVTTMRAKRAASPPDGAVCTILNKDHSYRAHIGEDGAVINCFGTLLGYLNVDAAEVASAEEYFLGCVKSDEVYDENDQEVGSINRGVGSVHDVLGSTVFEIDGAGNAKGATGVHLGQFSKLQRPFAFINALALYVLFLDPCFAKEEIDK